MILRFNLPFTVVALAALVGTGCATAGEPDNPSADAQIFVIGDARPGSPDAPINNPTPDAMVVVGTPDAMVVGPPDAMGCVDMVIQFLANANFDLGSGGGWIENGAGYPMVLAPTDPTYPLPVTPQTGNYAVWMGGLDSATRSIYQDVVIPAGATNVSVTGYRYIATEEIAGVYDTWTATLRNTGGGVIETLGSFTNADALEAWTVFAYSPITNIGGQTIRLHLENTNDITNNTNFFIDSLTLSATVCQ